MKENEPISIPKLASNKEGQFTGGFVELNVEEMSNTLGGNMDETPIGNSTCNDNGKCSGNGTCSGNAKSCSGNGVCVVLLPKQDEL